LPEGQPNMSNESNESSSGALDMTTS